MHTIAVLAIDGVSPGDLSAPCELFRPPDYAVRVCAPDPVISAGAFQVRAPWGLDGLRDADTVIVAGIHDIHATPPAAVGAALRAAWARGARIASICTGAFILAASGLLSGKRATTHWAAAGALAQRYPDVEVDPAVLFVDHGRLLTSAGAAAGLDLCIHLIRRDHGVAAAAAAARAAVMPLAREGGQAQFIDRPLPGDDSAIQPLLRWITAHLQGDLSVSALARRSHASPRTLARRFQDQVGMPPGAWVRLARIRAAQHLLETTALPIEHIAERVGFGAGSTLRERFVAVVGVPPRTYRRAFRHQGP